MSDFTKLPRDIAECIEKAGVTPLTDDQLMVITGYLCMAQLLPARAETMLDRLTNISKLFPYDQWLESGENSETNLADWQIEQAEHFAASYRSRS